MRITNGMMSRNLLNNLSLNMKRMNSLNKQATSGKRFDRPSDDPVGMSRSLKIYTDISRVSQYDRNVRDAESWLKSTEDGMIELESILQRTRELSVDISNGTKTESDAQNAAEEIKQLRDQVIKIGNMSHAGRTVFSGYNTDKKLLNDSGYYEIDLDPSQVSIYNVGVAEDLQINTLGSKVFGVKNQNELQFKNIDGENSLTIDIGDDNANLYGGIEIEVVRGGTPSSASWEDSKLTINLDKDETTENSESIRGLIAGATGNPPEDFEIADVTVSLIDSDGNKDTTDNTNTKYTDVDGVETVQASTLNLNSDKIKNKTASTRTTNTDMASEGQKSHIVDVFDQLISAMGATVEGSEMEAKFDQDRVAEIIDEVNELLNNTLSLRAEVGAKTNRIEMTSKRLDSQKLNFTEVLSANEDVDLAETMMKFMSAEAVYNASLSVGAKSIQPTLVDFIR